MKCTSSTGKHHNGSAAMRKCPVHGIKYKKLPSAKVSQEKDDNHLELIYDNQSKFSLKHLNEKNLRVLLHSLDDREIDTALELAEFVHQGQIRKTIRTNSSKQDNYIVHPMRNALRCYRWTGDRTHVIIALLHDTLEDGPERITEFFNSNDNPENTLREVFGDRVTDAIKGLSNDPNSQYDDHTTKEIRKNKDVFWTKLADWKDNPGSLLYSNPSPKRLKQARKYEPSIEGARIVAHETFDDEPESLFIIDKELDDISKVITQVIQEGQ